MPTAARKRKNHKPAALAGVRTARRDRKVDEGAALRAAYREALAQQAATSEILQVIAGMPNDPAPVFKAIARSALNIFRGMGFGIALVEGKELHSVGEVGNLRRPREDFRMPLSRDSVAGRAVIDRAIVSVADTESREAPPLARANARVAGFRSIAGAPLLRKGAALGALIVMRQPPGRWNAKELRLLEAFANQAAIAIENVRLFNETKEALERQTATAEILKVISQSPTDVQPVFETIARNAVKLCSAVWCAVFRVENGLIDVAAHHGFTAAALSNLHQRYPGKVAEVDSGSARSARAGQIVHLVDVANTPGVSEARRELARILGYRTQAFIPMLREGTCLGVIGVTSPEAAPFPDQQIALLQTFADQAVIAIENVRLFNETKEALERQTATADILKVISSSPTAVQPVFEAIVQSGMKLFPGATLAVQVPQGDRVELRAMAGPDRQRVKAWQESFPVPLSRDYVTAAAILDCKVIDIPDFANAPPQFAKGAKHAVSFGYRAGTIMPMARDGIAIGAIGLVRNSTGPLGERETSLLRTFADQAVIAIENVRLFNETKEALERQTAISEILEKISGSPTDVSPVLAAVAERAARLCEGEQATVLMLEDGDLLRPRFTYSSDRGPLPNPQTLVKLDRGYVTGRAAIEGRAINVDDVAALTDSEYPAGKENQQKLGYRSFLAAPMMRESKAIGVIAVWRRFVQPFSEKHVALVKTFADQAAIAIENVRLFNETKEALDRQTATSEILGVISSSPTDVRPVFDAILRSATTLCEAHFGILNLREGDHFRTVAQRGGNPEFGEWVVGRGPFKPEAYLLRVLAQCKAVQIPDLAATDEYRSRKTSAVKIVEVAKARTFLLTPLLKDGEVIGSIAIYRPEVRTFSDKQMALMSTFASQAVIAIENVRLFNETNEALAQQTGTAEVLKLISRTTFELEKVLQTLLDNATRLSGAVRAAMLRPDDEGNYRPVVTYNYDANGPLMRRMHERPIRPGRDSINGRALLDKRPIHVPDVLADTEYGRQDLTDIARYRTVLSVPMLRDGEVIGLIALVKGEEVDPFTEKQIEVVTTFADQAVIAIENVRLFREIEEKSRQLEVANKHKSDFLANMSHELRTPLNAIIGFSEALLERMFGELNEKQADYLQDIHESGRHLLSLINDILDLSKIEAGRMELELSKFDLPSAISNAMTLVRERAQRHGIALGAEIDPALGEFQADERKLKQILVNLLSNAVKFTADGGRVDVSAKRDTTRIEIAVRDTGIGIAPEDQAALFEEFRQVGRDALRKAEGTGLGLALTRKFVLLHGGDIRVASAPGKGSTFTVLLPIR